MEVKEGLFIMNEKEMKLIYRKKTLKEGKEIIRTLIFTDRLMTIARNISCLDMIL